MEFIIGKFKTINITLVDGKHLYTMFRSTFLEMVRLDATAVYGVDDVLEASYRDE